MLAIALQVMLPVAMIRAAVATLDPFGNLTICVSDPADGAGSGGVPGTVHRHACPTCPITVAPTALPATLSAGVPLPGLRVVATVVDPGRAPGPRGPPALWPPTRAPPDNT